MHICVDVNILQEHSHIFLQTKKRYCSKNIRIQTENYKFSREKIRIFSLSLSFSSKERRKEHTDGMKDWYVFVCVCESQSVLSPKDSKSLSEIPALFGFCFLECYCFSFRSLSLIPSLRLCILFKSRLRFGINKAIASSIINAHDIDNNLWVGFLLVFFFFLLSFKRFIKLWIWNSIIFHLNWQKIFQW